MPRLRLTLLTALLAAAAAACAGGDPCDPVMESLCAGCAPLTREWHAACLCYENRSYFELGCRCREPGEYDTAWCEAYAGIDFDADVCRPFVDR